MYIFVIIGLAISLIASINCKLTFSRYRKKASSRGIRAEEAARLIIQSAGIQGVSIGRVSGNMTDHYSPKEDAVYLSETVYGSSSISAIGVAAHECGHVIQHHTGYTPVNIRMAMIPVANIGSMLSYPIILLGLFFGWTGLAQAGVILFCMVVALQFITLPVEFNASRRALAVIRELNLLEGKELSGARKVLSAAAMTYVAALVTSLLQLMRLMALARRS